MAPTRRTLTAAFASMSAIVAFFASLESAQTTPLYDGWWVVIASPSLDQPARQDGDRARITAAAQWCGVAPFYDFSSKFKGFAPGSMAYVVGAYATRARAQRMAAHLRPCFPDAYVKYGRHLGE